MYDEDVLTPAEWLEMEEAFPWWDPSEDDDAKDDIDEPGSDNQPGQDDNFDEDEPVEEPKYELTDEVIQVGNRQLHRIRAVRSFGAVAEGDYGGWVGGPHNLSHEGSCWIFDNAMVMDDAYVFNDAQVRDEACVLSVASVGDCAKVLDQAWVEGRIYGDAVVRDTAVIAGTDSLVDGNAVVYGNAFLLNARVGEYACIKDNPVVIEPSIYDHVIIADTAIVIHEGSFDGVCTRLTGDTRLIESKTLDSYLPDRVLVSTNEIRRLLKNIYLAKVNSDDETAEALLRDPDDPNVFHMTVAPNQPVRLISDPLDPTADCEFVYRDVSSRDILNCFWDDVMAGQTDQITVVVTNERCGEASHTYLINVEIKDEDEEK